MYKLRLGETESQGRGGASGTQSPDLPTSFSAFSTQGEPATGMASWTPFNGTTGYSPVARSPDLQRHGGQFILTSLSPCLKYRWVEERLWVMKGSVEWGPRNEALIQGAEYLWFRWRADHQTGAPSPRSLSARTQGAGKISAYSARSLRHVQQGTRVQVPR